MAHDPQTPMRRSRSLAGRRLELRRHSGSDKRFLWNVLEGERGKMPAGNLGGMGTCCLSIGRGQILPTVVSITFFLQKPDCSEPVVHFGRSLGPVGQSIFRGEIKLTIVKLLKKIFIHSFLFRDQRPSPKQKRMKHQ